MEFNPDYTVWMDTIKEGRFNDTNALFEKPDDVDYHVEKWFDNAHKQLMPVVQRWMNINNV
jgi:adenylylsulfate kinase